MEKLFSLKILLVIIVFVIASISAWIGYKSIFVYPHLKTAKKVNLSKYIGTWYEIALLPNHFEKGCSCTQANYSLNHDGTIRVFNRCYRHSEKKETSIVGKAWSVNSANSKLKVQFYWPFRGDYWILHIDKDYKYALVGVPSRKYLWVLAREAKMSESEYKKLVKIARERGFDVTKLIKTDHENCHI